MESTHVVSLVRRMTGTHVAEASPPRYLRSSTSVSVNSPNSRAAVVAKHPRLIEALYGGEGASRAATLAGYTSIVL